MTGDGARLRSWRVRLDPPPAGIGPADALAVVHASSAVEALRAAVSERWPTVELDPGGTVSVTLLDGEPS